MISFLTLDLAVICPPFSIVIFFLRELNALTWALLTLRQQLCSPSRGPAWEPPAAGGAAPGSAAGPAPLPGAAGGAAGPSQASAAAGGARVSSLSRAASFLSRPPKAGAGRLPARGRSSFAPPRPAGGAFPAPRDPASPRAEGSAAHPRICRFSFYFRRAV